MKRFGFIKILAVFSIPLLIFILFLNSTKKREVEKIGMIAQASTSPFIFTRDFDQMAFGINTVREFPFDPVYGPVGQLFLESGAKVENHLYRWKDIEATKNVYTWDELDSNIKAYNQHDILVSMSLYEFPDWAVEESGRNVGGPMDDEDLGEYGELLRLLAERYDGDGINDAPGNPILNHFEPLNEIDSFHKYGSDDDLNNNGLDDYKDYAILQRTFYNEIKAANPSAIILFSGMALEDCCVFNINFLENVLAYSYQTWGKQFFDYMNLHYYEAFYNNWTGHENDNYSGGGVRGKIHWAKNLMAQYGAGDKPILFSEIGQPVNETVSEETQARLVFKLFSQSISTGEGPLLWFTLKDYFEADYGFVRLDNTIRPSFGTFKILVDEMKNYSYLAKEANSLLEGYVFIHNHLSGKFKEILWSRSATTENRDYFASSVIKTNKAGVKTYITDGGSGDTDGSANGQVKISVSNDPVIVEWGRPNVCDQHSPYNTCAGFWCGKGSTLAMKYQTGEDWPDNRFLCSAQTNASQWYVCAASYDPGWSFSLEAQNSQVIDNYCCHKNSSSWNLVDPYTAGKLSPLQHNFECGEDFYAWSSDSSSGSLVESASSQQAFQGNYALRADYAAGNQEWALYTNLTTNINPSDIVKASGKYFIASMNGPVKIKVGIQYWDTGLLGQEMFDMNIATGFWQDFTLSGTTVPSGTESIKIFFRFDEGSNATVYFDELYLHFIDSSLLTTPTPPPPMMNGFSCDHETWECSNIVNCSPIIDHPDCVFDCSQCAPGGPVAIFLSSFSATDSPEKVLIEWETAQEIDNLGFNLHRSSDYDPADPYQSTFTQINNQIILSQCLGCATPSFYEYLDEDVVSGTTYHYLLEDIDTSGLRSYHGPVEVLFTNPSPAPILGDVDGSGEVNTQDLKLVLENWGADPLGQAQATDLNDDQIVNILDLALVIANWSL
ncbi:hypothetical protein ACFL0Y_00115 [Patescibacteria group bacterium]